MFVWTDLYERREWDDLENWWRHSDDVDALSALLARLDADVPKVTARNGMEVEVRHVRPNEAPPDWKRAAQILELGELKAKVEGDPPSNAEIWRHDRDMISAQLRSLVVAGEVTMGDKMLSRANHAATSLALLDSTDFCVQAMANEIDPVGEKPEDRDWLIEFAQEILYLGFHAGLHARAAIGKSMETDAVRGEKVLMAAVEGGNQRRVNTNPATVAVLREMQRLIDGGHTELRAAELSAAKGIGTSATANRKLYQRHKEKLRHAPPLSQG